MKKIIPFIFCFILSQNIFSQKLIQFSGVVITSDSLTPIPFVNVIIQNTYRGTTTDFYGFFSFVAQPGDSIRFNCLGYRPAVFVIPDTLTEKRYSVIQVLMSDTFELDPAFVYPWPSREEFRDAFIHLKVPNDDYQRALYNLDQQRMLERMDMTSMDGSMNYKYQMQQYQTKIYHAGQLPPMNIYNPLSWAQFIQAWKRGDYKKK